MSVDKDIGRNVSLYLCLIFVEFSNHMLCSFISLYKLSGNQAFSDRRTRQNRQIETQTDTDRQRQTDEQAGRQKDKQSDKHAEIHVDGRLVELMNGSIRTVWWMDRQKCNRQCIVYVKCVYFTPTIAVSDMGLAEACLPPRS